MDKRYQVFVSSTYTDLVEARAEVMQALLELDCMPAGMELFPAANQEQWKWIKRVIDESDYYLVIVAGRYGSISRASGQSYTEMEYRYAVETGRPVIAFIHQNPSTLQAKFCETTIEGSRRLSKFRDLVEKKLCKHWTTPSDLGAKVSRSITQLMKQVPAVGWIRANTMSEQASKEALDLRRQVDDLQIKLAQVTAEGPPGVEDLSSGSDIFSLTFLGEQKLPKTNRSDLIYWVKGPDISAAIDISWDDLFAHLAPALMQTSDDWRLSREINELLTHRAMPLLRKKYPKSRISNIGVYTETFQTIKIQLRALGLIAAEDDKWVLTEYGNSHMNKMLAVHKPQPVTPKKKRKQPSEDLFQKS